MESQNLEFNDLTLDGHLESLERWVCQQIPPTKPCSLKTSLGPGEQGKVTGFTIT